MNSVEGVAALVVGYVWQWCRAPKKFPNWASYTLFGCVAAIVWYVVTPNADELVRSNWRSAVGAILLFGAASRGIASVSSEVKAAPKTDSL